MIKTPLLIAIALTIISGFTFFTQYEPEEITLPPSAIFYAKEGNHDWLKMKDGVAITARDLVARYKADLGLGLGDELVLYRTDKDPLGFLHYRYQHYYQGVKVQGSQLLVHEKDGRVQTLNGKLVKRLKENVEPAISPEEALDRAVVHVHALRYMWENHQAETLLKRIKNDPSATFYPQPTLILVAPYFSQNPNEYRLAYGITIHAMMPESKSWLFVDARTGEIFHEIDMLHTQATNSPGVAETKYHGTREIITDSVGLDSFRLYETTRGRGVHTFNINNATDTSFAVDFYDNDNYWNNVNSDEDEAATDAHWGAEMTFDYYLKEHDHLGVDGDSMALISFVHYGNDVTNAFWNGAFASFGDGGGTATPLTALDVVGHEFTHGITDFTADLIYQRESGALNESFSDIFGTAIEFWADPATGDWEIGEDFLLQPFRDMSNPNRFGHPDTYFGDFWATGPGDNGGVHTNSGVQNYWFYLLTVGAVDTNDIDNAFEVIGLGIDTAAQIAFRNLKYYLTESSGFNDARFGSVQAAADLFGDCSFEMKQVVSAWYAVGVGPKNPTRDIGLAGVSGIEPFKCGVNEDEFVVVKLTFSDCDSILPVGTKIPVYYQVDGGNTIWDTVQTTTALAYGDSISFTFSQPVAALSQPGTYTLTIGADLNNDNTPENNATELTIRRIYDQNVDLGMNDVPLPLPGCLLGNEKVAVAIGFEGCDSIEAGQPLEVFYQVNGGAVVSESITVPFNLSRGETFVHTFSQEADLSDIRNHRIDAWAVYTPDTLMNNDSLLAHLVVNPVLMKLEDFISFEAGMASMDSFYYLTGLQSRVFISPAAKQAGQFGLQVTGGDVVTAFFKNEVTLPEVTTVWDLNPQFRSQICFCANLEGLLDADFKFRMKQTYSNMYKLDFGINTNLVSAARVLINGDQVSLDFFPNAPSGSPYYNQIFSLDNYLGTTAEICIETSTLLDVALDPYGMGDNVYIDNVTIVGTPTAVFEPLLPDVAVNVFPNPSTGQFVLSLELDAALDGVLKVTDMLGRNILQKPLQLLAGKHNLNLELNKATSGTYYIQVISKGKMVVKEVVVF